MTEQITELLGWSEEPTAEEVAEENKKQQEAIKSMEEEIRKAEEKQIDQRLKMAVLGIPFVKSEETPVETRPGSPAEGKKGQPNTEDLIESLRNDL